MGKGCSRGAHLPHVLSKDETTALLRACTSPFERAVIGLLIESGLRPREVCALQARDLRRDVVHAQGKDGRTRRVALSPHLSEALQLYVHERGAAPRADEPLLLALDGQPLDVRALGFRFATHAAIAFEVESETAASLKNFGQPG